MKNIRSLKPVMNIDRMGFRQEIFLHIEFEIKNYINININIL